MGSRMLPGRRDDNALSVQKMFEDDPDRVIPFSGRNPWKGWFHAFLRRHKGLRVRKPERISKSRLLVMKLCVKK